MLTNTKNKLQDFDMCLAIGELAINGGLIVNWKAWKKNRQINDLISLKIPGANNERADIKLAAPAISLDTDQGSTTRVKVTLTIESGKVFFNTGNKPGSEPVSNWKFSFITDLGKRKTDFDTLKKIDPEGYNNARSIVNDAIDKDKRLTDSVFSLEYLFLELTAVNLSELKESAIQIPPGIRDEAITVVKKALDIFIRDELSKSGFMLGTIVRRTPTYSIPTFTLTDYIYEINRAENASALTYLGMFSGRPLPSDSRSAINRMPDPWLNPEMLGGSEGTLAGLLVIRKEIFMYDYFADNFNKALRKSKLMTEAAAGRYEMMPLPYITDRLVWHYPYQFKETRMGVKGAILKSLYELAGDAAVIIKAAMTFQPDVQLRQLDDTEWNIAFFIEPETNKMRFEGSIYTNILTTIHLQQDLLVTDINIEAGANRFSGTSHFKGVMELKGETEFLNDGLLQQFQIKPVLLGDIIFEGFQITKNEGTGIFSLRDVFLELMKQTGLVKKTISELIAEQQNSVAANIRSLIEKMIADFNVDISKNTFVPPGGSVLIYQNPQFTCNGDLMISAIIEDPAL